MLIGSDTTPVREVVNGENGVLVPFFDHEQLANKVIEALAQPRRFQSMRAAARRTAVEQFDQRISLPQMMALLGVERRPDAGKNAGKARAPRNACCGEHATCPLVG